MTQKLTRLTAPNGASVLVDSEKAKRLVASEGYKAAEEPKKTTAKKAASSKSES